MIRLLPVAVVAATLTTLAQPAGPLLRLELVAQDGEGRPVADLAPADLEVRIGAYHLPLQSLQHVTAADPERVRDVVLLLDDVTLTPATGPRVRDVARRFVNRMAPGDRITIATLDGELMEGSEDRQRLLADIERYTGLGKGIIPIDRLGRHFLEVLPRLVERFPEDVRRPVIVGIGSAWLFDTPVLPGTVAPTVRPEWSAAMRAIARVHATLYVVDPNGVGGRIVGGGDHGFARETGGLAFVNTNDFLGAADRIMREAGDYYEAVVRDPPVGRQADLRKLEVRSLRRGVEVRARRWLEGREVD